MSRCNGERDIPETAENYERLSCCYDILAAAEKPAIKRGLKLLEPSAGEQVLEIGCGTGRALVRMAERIDEGAGRIYGLDASGRMLEKSREKLKRAGLADRVELIEGDARFLRFPAEKFEAVFVSFVLELFEEEELLEILEEIRRVLKPEGRLVTVNLARKEESELEGLGVTYRLYVKMHRIFPGLVDCRPLKIGPYLSRVGFAVEDREESSMLGIPVEITLAGPEKTLAQDNSLN